MPTLCRARVLSAWNLLGSAAEAATWTFPAKPYDQHKRAREANASGLTTTGR